MEFDTKGNLIPYEIISSSHEDLKVFFVDNFPDSSTRKIIFDSHNRYLNDILTELISEFTQWIDGSFVTSKENPNDVDIINHLDWSEELNSKAKIISKFMTQFGSKEAYNVDGYFIFKYDRNDERYDYYQKRKKEWAGFFMKDRKNQPKGMLEIQVSSQEIKNED